MIEEVKMSNRKTKSLKSTKKTYMLVIKPAIMPAERHEIQNTLRKLGYRVIGGGTDVDMSECDIAFEK